MKCPACGFETPDAQAWCDFCKEPFKRPAPPQEAPPPPPPPPPPPAPKAALPPSEPAKAPMSDEEIFALLRRDTAQARPESPLNVRYLAWGFFALMMFWVMVMSVYLIGKGRRIQKSPGPSPLAGPASGPAKAPPLPPGMPPVDEKPVFESATVDVGDGSNPR